MLIPRSPMWLLLLVSICGLCDCRQALVRMDLKPDGSLLNSKVKPASTPVLIPLPPTSDSDADDSADNAPIPESPPSIVGTDEEIVPDQTPQCILSCIGDNPTNQGCLTLDDSTIMADSDTAEATEACRCFRVLEKCALDSCSSSGLSAAEATELAGYFDALGTTSRETCTDLGRQQMETARLAGIAEAAEDENGGTALLARISIDRAADAKELLQPDQTGNGDDLARPHGSMDGSQVLGDNLEVESNALGAIMSGFLASPITINGPTGCKASDMNRVGDGKCDGDAYNTEACNWDGGDCCENDCRPANFMCGSAGYTCKGTPVLVSVDSSFQCDEKKLEEFQKLFASYRDSWTTGASMQDKARCSQLTKAEHSKMAQAWNVGIKLMGGSAKMRSAEAQTGGPKMAVACKLWTEQMGNAWFGTLIVHEMGHIAGYSHPKFSDATFKSECRVPNEKLCSGHCIEWIGACETHASFGSTSCGTGGFGCQAQCVKDEYCNSFPERATECLGYQKVHSRGESLIAGGEGALGKAGEVADKAGKEIEDKAGVVGKEAGGVVDKLGKWGNSAKGHAAQHRLFFPAALLLMTLLNCLG